MRRENLVDMIRLRIFPAPILMLVGVIATTTATAFSQTKAQTSSVSARPSCAQCNIELTRVATLGSDADPAFIDPNSKVTRDSRGRYYAWSTDRATIIVFDSSGRYLQTVGHWGKGPGEFQNRHRPIVPLRDNGVAVLQLNSIDYFDASYKLVRVVSLRPGPVFGNVLALSNGEMILASHLRTPDRVGMPLQAVDRAGKIRLSFGGESADFDYSKCGVCDMRFVAAVAGSTQEVWAVRARNYVLERWSTSGRLVQRLKMQGSPWWPKGIGEAMEGGTVQPSTSTPMLRGVWTEPNGLVFVLGNFVPDGQILTSTPSQSGGGIGVVTSTAKWNTVVEVIDPVKHLLVTSRRYPNRRMEAIEDGFVYSVDEDSSGEIRFNVWRVSIKYP